MELYYAPNIHQENYLAVDEAKHCLKVMRHKAGDRIYVTDGNGKMWKVVLLSDNPEHCQFEIVENVAAPYPINTAVCIAIAPTKNSSRFEWFLEKATELGIMDIRPMLCQRSVRTKLNSKRLEKILITASKQCLRTQFPRLFSFLKFTDVLEICAAEYQSDQLFIASCEKDITRLQKAYNKSGKAIVLIGPEGGFTGEESEKALKAGFKAVSLAKARLRTETAGIIAVHTIQLMHQL